MSASLYMADLALRVAARYHQRVASDLLSEAWVKEQFDELTRELATPLGEYVENWPGRLYNTAIYYFTGLLKRFEAATNSPAALSFVRERCNSAQSYIGFIHKKWDGLIEKGREYPDTTEGRLAAAMYEEILEWISKRAGTVRDLLETDWSIKTAQIDILAKKYLRKMSEDDRYFFVANYSSQASKKRILESLGFPKMLPSCVSQSALDWSAEGALRLLFKGLREKFEGDGDDIREFDLYGIKVLVQDSSLGPGDIEKYVKYLKEAYYALKAKGLASTWYGNVFIECESCGGVNPNTGGGVGGHLKVRKDTVSIFDRPSPDIVDLMTHELGHRYWFRQMKEGQRERFRDLVKVRPADPRPEVRALNLIEGPYLLNIRNDLDASRKEVETLLVAMTKSRLRSFRKVLDAFENPADDLAAKFRAKLMRTIELMADSDMSPGTKGLMKDAEDATWEATKTLSYLSESILAEVNAMPDGTQVEDAFRAAVKNHHSKVRETADTAIAAVTIFVDMVAIEHNEAQIEKGSTERKEWDRKYKQDPRPVLPVSGYGESNSDEAFAEVFSHYVMEKDMSRDQLESFRSVLSSQMTAKEAVRAALLEK